MTTPDVGDRPGVAWVASFTDFVSWALAAPLPSSRSIGSHAIGRVLVALAVHADGDGVCWPSAETIAREVSGLTRRDVRNALDMLLAAGLIAVDGQQVRGRVTRWRLLAGHPATSGRELAGTPAKFEGAQDPVTPDGPEMAGNVAGELAGNVAGELAGDPATNRTEQNKNPNNTRSPAARPTATDLPGDFAPNRANRAAALAFGLNADALVEPFRRWAAGKRRRTWHRVFGAFINWIADGNAPEDFQGS